MTRCPGSSVCRRTVSTQGTTGVDPEDHAGPAAKRPIVDRTMAIGGPVANVVQMDLDQAALDRQLQQALTHVSVENLGKQGQDVETHRRALLVAAGFGCRLGLRCLGARLAAAGSSAGASFFRGAGLGKSVRGSGRRRDWATRSSARCCCSRCVPSAPYFLISALTLSLGEAPTLSQYWIRSLFRTPAHRSPGPSDRRCPTLRALGRLSQCANPSHRCGRTVGADVQTSSYECELPRTTPRDAVVSKTCVLSTATDS